MSHSDWEQPTGSVIPHALLFVVQIVALLAPPFPYRRAVALSAIASLALVVQAYPHFTNDLNRSQPFSIAWTFYTATLDKFLFSADGVPEKSFWHLSEPNQSALAYAPFGWKKLLWAAGLTFNPRAIRWNHQVKNVPQLEPVSRWSFVRRQLVRYAYYTILYDLCAQLSLPFFYGTTSSQEAVAMDASRLVLYHEIWYFRALKLWVWGAKLYFMTQMQHAQGAMASVAMGLFRPEDWPPLFGGWTQAYTIRKFWGYSWHQIVRRNVSIYPIKLVEMLGIRHGSLVSSYSQLWLGFLISGLFHASSLRHLPRPANVNLHEQTIGVILFFLWQALAITMEDFAQWCWRGGRECRAESTSRLAKTVGFAWVTLSFYLCIPLAGDPFLRMKLDTTSLLPLSMWQAFAKQVPALDRRAG